MTNILDIQNLKTYFHTEAGIVKAIDGISLHVEKGETLGLVGESGSGKTMTALSVLNIVPNPGKINSGKILFNNNVISNLDEDQMRKISKQFNVQANWSRDTQDIFCIDFY